MDKDLKEQASPTRKKDLGLLTVIVNPTESRVSRRQAPEHACEGRSVKLMAVERPVHCG